jgi:hypothetical protein
MTLGICHSRGGIMVNDLIRERRPPFSPDAVVKEFSDTLKSYGITRVYGDRYGGEWPREAFRKHGIEYKVADKTKSEIYLALLPLLNSGRVELLDHQRLVSQLCSLERRTSRAGTFEMLLPVRSSSPMRWPPGRRLRSSPRRCSARETARSSLARNQYPARTPRRATSLHHHASRR